MRELFRSYPTLSAPSGTTNISGTNMEQGFPFSHKHGTCLLVTPMADTATSGVALSSPLLPLHHPMAETGETQAETEEPGSEGPQAFFPLWKHCRDEENSEGTGRACPRTGSKEY